MRLSELLAGLLSGVEVTLDGDPEILSVTHDSRRVEPGALFVAWRGERYDGSSFALDAEQRGASAMIGEGERPLGLSIPYLRSADCHRLLGKLASRLAGNPDRKLTMVGITGTNGKGTVASIVASILEAAGRRAGLFGTHGIEFEGLAFPSGGTTAEASDLFSAFESVAREGGDSVVMEVSSHALSVGRVRDVRFDVVAFTNLSHDHLDFHGDIESYMAAKRQLFDLRKPESRSVIFVDDPRGRDLADGLEGNVIRVGEGGDVYAESVEINGEGIRAVLGTSRGRLTLNSPLLGGFNFSNLLMAVGIAEALELETAAIVRGLANAGALDGRMERVSSPDEIPVVVDYAHTPAALEAALRGMREIGTGNLIAVFGCGGDRDQSKRRSMGRIAGLLADLPIATSDNPRGEDPTSILAAVEKGLVESGNESYRIVPDRREAIRRAIVHADASSSVLIAGKGHENQQIVGDRVLPFSDREEAHAALEVRRGSVARV